LNLNVLFTYSGSETVSAADVSDEMTCINAGVLKYSVNEDATMLTCIHK